MFSEIFGADSVFVNLLMLGDSQIEQDEVFLCRTFWGLPVLETFKMLALIFLLFLRFVFVFLVESFYRERYIQKSKEQEQLRKKLQSQAEQEIEELSNQKRTLERKVGPLLLNLAEYLLVLANSTNGLVG